MKTKKIVPESGIKKLRNFSKTPMNERALENKKKSKLMQNNEEAFKIFVEKQWVYD